jgi:hypothetical protein
MTSNPTLPEEPPPASRSRAAAGTYWEPGDIAVVHSTSLVGAAIRVLQDWSGGSGQFEHVIVGVDGGQIVEAVPGGARHVPFHYDPQYVYWSHDAVPLTAAQRRKVVSSALWYAGEGGAEPVPYSFGDYLAIAAHCWHIPAPGLADFIADTGHMICSQLADQCLADAGVHLFTDGRWPGYVRPYDIECRIGARPLWAPPAR